MKKLKPMRKRSKLSDEITESRVMVEARYGVDSRMDFRGQPWTNATLFRVGADGDRNRYLAAYMLVYDEEG